MLMRKIVLEGIYWTTLLEVFTKLLGLVASILISRILLPEDFGVIAVIGIFLSFASALANAGLTTSLIRNENVGEDDYATVFFYNLLSSIVLVGILFILSPMIAAFFKSTVITGILRVLSLSLIIQSLFVISNVKLTKQLKYKELAIYNLSATVFGTMVGLICVYNNFGVWSLVIQSLSIEIIKGIIIFFNENWRPKFIFKKEIFQKHFSFGYKLTASIVLNTIFNEIYTFVIGRYYSVSQLGYYWRANSLSLYPSQMLSVIVHKVSFPFLSTINDDDNKLMAIQKLTTQAILFVIAPILIISSVVALPLFAILFTEKWLEAAPMYQILIFSSLLYPIHAFNLQVVIVKGRSDLFLRAEMIKKIILMLVVGISLLMGGLNVILLGSVAISVFALFINMYFCSKVLPFTVMEQFESLIPVLFFITIMGIFIYGIGHLFHLGHLSHLWSVILFSIVSLTLYFSIAYIFKLGVLLEIIKFVR